MAGAAAQAAWHDELRRLCYIASRILMDKVRPGDLDEGLRLIVSRNRQNDNTANAFNSYKQVILDYARQQDLTHFNRSD